MVAHVVFSRGARVSAILGAWCGAGRVRGASDSHVTACYESEPRGQRGGHVPWSRVTRLGAPNGAPGAANVSHNPPKALLWPPLVARWRANGRPRCPPTQRVGGGHHGAPRTPNGRQQRARAGAKGDQSGAVAATRQHVGCNGGAGAPTRRPRRPWGRRGPPPVPPGARPRSPMGATVARRGATEARRGAMAGPRAPPGGPLGGVDAEPARRFGGHAA